jgi:hypothetical protein
MRRPELHPCTNAPSPTHPAPAPKSVVPLGQPHLPLPRHQQKEVDLRRRWWRVRGGGVRGALPGRTQRACAARSGRAQQQRASSARSRRAPPPPAALARPHAPAAALGPPPGRTKPPRAIPAPQTAGIAPRTMVAPDRRGLAPPPAAYQSLETAPSSSGRLGGGRARRATRWGGGDLMGTCFGVAGGRVGVFGFGFCGPRSAPGAPMSPGPPQRGAADAAGAAARAGPCCRLPAKRPRRFDAPSPLAVFAPTPCLSLTRAAAGLPGAPGAPSTPGQRHVGAGGRAGRGGPPAETLDTPQPTRLLPAAT